MMKRSIGLAVLAALFAVGGARAMTLSSGDSNIIELLSQSNDIVVGRVDAVTDGIDERGIPYTEVTLHVSEAIRGEIAGTYTFRQFGLVTPRITADGKRKMMPSPTGFPKYAPGEDLALFLRPSAAWTGFRMPAGVTDGKFKIGAGRAENGMGNAGLFKNVHVDRGLVTESDKRLLATASGPVNPDAFLSFVRRAVKEHWVESERMTRSDRHEGPRIPPPSEPRDARAPVLTAQPAVPKPPTVLLDPKTNSGLPGSGR